MTLLTPSGLSHLSAGGPQCVMTSPLAALTFVTTPDAAVYLIWAQLPQERLLVPDARGKEIHEAVRLHMKSMQRHEGCTTI